MALQGQGCTMGFSKPISPITVGLCVFAPNLASDPSSGQGQAGPSLTFGGEDLGQHHAQAVGAGVARRHQTQQQQAGAGAQEAQLFLRAAQTRVEEERPGLLLLPVREPGGKGLVRQLKSKQEKLTVLFSQASV